MSDQGSELIIERDLEIQTRDGVTLRADVYRPAGGDAHPVLLGRTCYGKDSWGKWIDPIGTAGEGYAVVINDTRGSFSSEGEFKPFFSDINDGYDVVEWCGTQPWSSGKVGMFGSSAPGFVQLLAAIAQPPHLVAIAPMQTWSSFGRGCVYDPGGAFLVSTLWWALHQACIDPRRRLGEGEAGYPERVDAASEALWDLARWSSYDPLTEVPALPRRFTDFFHEWLAHPDADDFWAPLDIERRYREITVPALHLVGWFDKFAFGSSRNYRGIADVSESELARRNQRIIFGPWPHGLPVQASTGYGHFGPGAEADVRRLILDWYDHWLKGIDNNLVDKPPVQLFVLGENKWREASNWPLPETRYQRYYLHSDGDASGNRQRGWLSTERPAQEPADAYRYDPADPAPSFTANVPEIGRAAAPRPESRRADVLTFSTPPLDEETEIAGPLAATIWAASTGADTDWVVRLADEAPDGLVRVLSEGMIRARYRQSQSAPAPVQAGETLEYTIELVPIANAFLIGHRIRVEISSSAAPLYHPNLNTGGGYDEAGPGVPATNLVFHDRAHPSAIVLPLVPRAGRG